VGVRKQGKFKTQKKRRQSQYNGGPPGKIEKKLRKKSPGTVEKKAEYKGRNIRPHPHQIRSRRVGNARMIDTVTKEKEVASGSL